MKTKQVQQNKEIVIHDFDKGLNHTLKTIESELSEKNAELIKKYDKEMVRNSLAKGTRLKHLLIILNLSRMLKKDWKDVTRVDIEELVYQFIQRYSPDGKETHHTWDHKKILKIFFRWIKLGSRQHRDVGNPEFKSEGTTLVLSIVLVIFGIAGVGHMYIGQVGKGVGILIGGIILLAIGGGNIDVWYWCNIFNNLSCVVHLANNIF